MTAREILVDRSGRRNPGLRSSRTDGCGKLLVERLSRPWRLGQVVVARVTAVRARTVLSRPGRVRRRAGACRRDPGARGRLARCPGPLRSPAWQGGAGDHRLRPRRGVRLDRSRPYREQRVTAHASMPGSASGCAGPSRSWRRTEPASLSARPPGTAGVRMWRPMHAPWSTGGAAPGAGVGGRGSGGNRARSRSRAGGVLAPARAVSGSARGTRWRAVR